MRSHRFDQVLAHDPPVVDHVDVGASTTVNVVVIAAADSVDRSVLTQPWAATAVGWESDEFTVEGTKVVR